MERSKIKSILAKCFKKLDFPRPAPGQSDWEKLGARFDYSWPRDFVTFIELCSEYNVDWQFLAVIRHTDHDSDTIECVYDNEMRSGQWEEEYIPFHDVGNGDYYCLKSNDLSDCVYYFDHEIPEYRKSENSFEEWIRRIPEVFA